MQVEFHGLTFDLPQGWLDVTDDLEAASPPTLAREDGVGAIQFSVGRYAGGADPRIGPDDVLGLLREFCTRNGIRGSPDLIGNSALIGALASSTVREDFVAVWQLSNGRDVVLMTYLCDAAAVGRERELLDAQRIALSLQFQA